MFINRRKNSSRIMACAVASLYLAFSINPVSAGSKTNQIPKDTKRSFIVLPVANDNVEQQALVAELTDVVREDLNNSYVVLGKSQTDEIIKYYSGSIDEKAVSVIDHLNKANDLYFKGGNPKQAISYINKAIHTLRSRARINEEESNLLVMALMALSKISFDTKSFKESREAIKQILSVLPAYNLDPKFYPPNFRDFFAKIKDELNTSAKGSLKITTVPLAVPVFLDGIYIGLSPDTFSELNAGQYDLTLSAPHRSPVKRKITISPDQTTIISGKLKWEGDGKTEFTAKNETQENLLNMSSSIGKRSGVDRVVWVGINAQNRPFAKIIDVETMQGLNDVVYRKVKNFDKSAPKIASYLVRNIRKCADKNVLEMNSDDVGKSVVVDARVHALKKKPFYKKPLVWILVGTALLGGLITGVALAVGGPAAAATGSLSIVFK